ncbi:MAG: ABC transporter permease, partial [Clostridia bacterium]|nr:ABC transporter permease [Clostridia bacterium]
SMNRSGAVNPTFLPSPWAVARRGWELVAGSGLWPDVGISVFRVTVGFLAAAALAAPLGVLAGAFGLAEGLLVPLCEFIRYMPASAFIPLVMVWAGIGELAKIIIIFIGTFFQLLLMVVDDTRRVPGEFLQAAATLGASRWQSLRHVLLPGLAPHLWDTLRITLGWAWTYLVVAELVAANSGLGFRIMKAQRFLQTDVIFVGILAIGLMGLASDWAFKLARRRLFPWAEGGA